MSDHHNSFCEIVPGTWVVAKPLRMSWGWHRWKRERKCARTINHCYHAEGMIDWFCCMCGKKTDGTPPDDCVVCTSTSKRVDNDVHSR